MAEIPTSSSANPNWTPHLYTVGIHIWVFTHPPKNDTFLFDFWTHHRSILHRSGAVHFCPTRQRQPSHPARNSTWTTTESVSISNKVIATMMIRPLDAVVTDLRHAGLGYVGAGMSSFVIRPLVPISSPLTHMVYMLPFSSYLAGSKGFPPVRPGYDDKYRSSSYRFVERQ